MTFSLLHSNHFCMLRKYYTGNTPFREINFPKFSPFFLTDNKIKAKSDRWRHLLAFCWSVEMLKPGCGTMKDVRRKYQNCVRKGPWWTETNRTRWYDSESPLQIRDCRRTNGVLNAIFTFGAKMETVITASCDDFCYEMGTFVSQIPTRSFQNCTNVNFDQNSPSSTDLL